MPDVSLPEHRYSRTEATRLLCAGVHQDPGFRRRVVDELVGHRERPVALPNGVDVLPVLAHALLAGRQETRTALLMLGVWAAFALSDVIMFWDSLSDRWGDGADVGFGDVLTALFQGDDRLTGGLPLPWFLFYALTALGLWLAHTVSGKGATARAAGLPDPVAKAADGAGSLLTLLAAGFALFYWYWYLSRLFDGAAQTPYPALFPLALAVVAWSHQSARRTALCRWLSRWTFAAARQPGLPAGALFEGVRDDIRREQEAFLTLYDDDSPFVGLGVRGTPWSFAMELRERPAADGGLPRQRPGPLTARAALDLIEPQLTGLRESAARTGKDRLRDVEIDRVVYLPGGVGRAEELATGGVSGRPDPADPGTAGADRRGLRVHDPAQVAAHLREAVDEGGEGRRVFLRIRVGAWQEQVVVTVLVRVHTQGRMLVLEVEPYVLGPVRKDFRAVDAFVERLPETWPRAALRALRHAPTIGVDAAVGALGTLRGTWSARFGGEPLPDVPRVSLRALASAKRLSVFQEMDATRYVKTIQERIVNGVREALKTHGYRTEEFEQHVYQLSGGSVFVGAMSGGAIATGRHGSATHTDNGAAPTGPARNQGEPTP
ncbi:hypothetical protein AB0G32_08825 [Streptomyces sp. NPDC023723]|uniref:hypothetical protein n=1 Tax=Streptomyces sp. NPDC023723 TaxID=3154323 RepID=UPI00340798A7